MPAARIFASDASRRNAFVRRSISSVAGGRSDDPWAPTLTCLPSAAIEPRRVELAALGEHLLRERKEIVQERVQIGMSHGTARAET
jgi:hypothetical protein